MRKTYFRHTIAALLTLTFAAPLFARGQFWDFLGQTQVDSDQDHRRIQITRHDLRFRTIQLRVSGEALFFDRVVVHFVDGTSQGLLIGARISPEGRNYVIELRSERTLESVELWYYKEAWGHNPTVSAYGIRLPDSDGESTTRKQ